MVYILRDRACRRRHLARAEGMLLLLLMVHGDADDEDAEAAMTAEVRMQVTCEEWRVY